MDKKGQMMGTLLIVFIGVLVGAVLLLPVAQIVGDATNSVQANNITYTAAANATWIDLAGQELLDTPVIWNVSGGNRALVSDANFTIVERVSTLTGTKTVGMQTTDPLYSGATINLTYSYGQDGYIDNAGARSVALLITIFMALGVAVIALTPTLKSGVLELMGK